MGTPMKTARITLEITFRADVGDFQYDDWDPDEWANTLSMDVDRDEKVEVLDATVINEFEVDDDDDGGFSRVFEDGTPVKPNPLFTGTRFHHELVGTPQFDEFMKAFEKRGGFIDAWDDTDNSYSVVVSYWSKIDNCKKDDYYWFYADELVKDES